MTNPSNQHDSSSKPGSQKPSAFTCADVEARLTDAVENTLPAAEAQALADHKITCARCRALYTQAMQGRQWLQLLHDELLEPSPTLVNSILARTSGLAQPGGLAQPIRRVPQVSMLRPGMVPAPANALPAIRHAAERSDEAAWTSSPRPWKPVRYPVLATLRHAARDPRLSLTAAMAFFSISLTLNLLGIHLNDFRPSNLTANHLRLTLTRQYVMANSSVVRYYENLRFVYEVESSVQQLRRAAESSDNSSDSAQPSKSKSKDGSPNKSGSSNPSGSSHPAGSSSQDHPQPGREPFARTPSTPSLQPSVRHAPARVVMGPPLEASAVPAIARPAAPVAASIFVPTPTCGAMELASAPVFFSRPGASLPSTPGLPGAPGLAVETWGLPGRPAPLERSAV